ncbi:MAG: glycosyltransferase family 4 protein [Candidatus Binataceae bacterium]
MTIPPLSEVKVAVDCRLGSGVATIFKNIVPRLARNLKRVIVLGPDDPRKAWGVNEDNVEHVPFDPRVYSAAEQYRFPWRVVTAVDLLHVPHYNVPLGWPKPLVVTLHDLTQFIPEFGAGALRCGIARSFIRWSLWRANEVLTVSEYSRADFAKAFGAAANRLRIAYNGVDRTVFRPMNKGTALERVRRHIRIEQPYILSVGSVRPHKNVSGLIAAFALAKQQFALKHNLVICGERQGFSTNTEIKIPSGLWSEVKFTGRISDDLLPFLYAGADAFVFPSLHEGFGIPPLEAMACGIPTVVSNRASLPEVVGDASILVDPDDTGRFARAINDIVSDIELRERLIEAGFQRTEKFSWDVTAERYLEAYSRAVTS